MEGVEHQVAGLGHYPRGQNQSQLTGCAKPAATEGCAGAAVRNGAALLRSSAVAVSKLSIAGRDLCHFAIRRPQC